VVEAFLPRSKMESFWLDQTNPDYAPLFISKLAIWRSYNYTAAEVLRLAGMFTTMIDRSPPLRPRIPIASRGRPR